MKWFSQSEDSPLDIEGEILLNHNRVEEMKWHIDTKDPKILALLKTPLHHEYFGADSGEDFLQIPYSLRQFILSFKSYTHNLIYKPDSQTLIIGMPAIPNFLEGVFLRYPTVRINESQMKVGFSTEIYPLRYHWDVAHNRLSLSMPSPIYLLSAQYQNFVLVDGVVRPLQAFFSNEITERLFTETSIEPDYELKNLLLSKKLENPVIVERIINLPQTRSFQDETIRFYFDIQTNNQFIVKAYFILEKNGKTVLAPFLFEEIRKTQLLSENLIVADGDNELFIALPNTPYYEKVKKIIAITQNCFYEFLNEIDGNKILPHDVESLFQKYFPAVEEHVEIVGQENRLKLVWGDFSEKNVIVEDPENHSPSRIDWFEVRFIFKIKDIELSLSELKKIVKDGFLIKNDTVIGVSKTEIEELSDFFTGLRIEEEANRDTISRYNLPFLLNKNLQVKLPEKLQQMPHDLDSAFGNRKSVGEIPLPEGLSKILRNYQKTGVYWLHFLNRYGFGGILADEMGLGKTIQVLTFLLSVKGNGPTLIVCPTALIYNWVAEIQKFIGLELRYLVIDGSKAERQKKIAQIPDFDLVITSYPLLHNDSEDYKAVMFYYCILDEAQHIKNKGAKRTLSIKEINAHNRIAMTGTPVENNVWELWSIFDFLMPDFLGAPMWFRKHIENPLNSFNKNERTSALKKLKTAIKPFILRRMKANVLKELPPKIEQEIILELTEKQKALYLETIQTLKNNYLEWVENRSHAIELLSLLTRLRQICLHPALLNNELLNVDDISIKLKALLELVFEAMDSGHRIVIFSQFVQMLKIVRMELFKAEIEYLYLDGQTKNRVEMVEHFNNSNIPVFLVSLKAGGTGLNLIGADSVILFDPWWNPAVESQAIDRVHRLGQTQTVNVYRLMTKGTIEEKIKMLQNDKREIFDNLVVNNESFIKNMKPEDIKSLFELD